MVHCAACLAAEEGGRDGRGLLVVSLIVSTQVGWVSGMEGGFVGVDVAERDSRPFEGGRCGGGGGREVCRLHCCFWPRRSRCSSVRSRFQRRDGGTEVRTYSTYIHLPTTYSSGLPRRDEGFFPLRSRHLGAVDGVGA